MTIAEHGSWKRRYLKMAREAVKRRDWYAAADFYRSAAFHEAVADHKRKDRSR